MPSSRSCRGRGRSASSRSIRSRRGRRPQSHGSPGSSGSAVSRSRKDSGSVEPSSRSQAAGQEAQRLTSRKGPYSSMNRGWVRQVRDVAPCWPLSGWISQILSVLKGTAAPEGGPRDPLVPGLESLLQLPPGSQGLRIARAVSQSTTSHFSQQVWGQAPARQ